MFVIFLKIIPDSQYSMLVLVMLVVTAGRLAAQPEYGEDGEDGEFGEFGSDYWERDAEGEVGSNSWEQQQEEERDREAGPGRGYMRVPVRDRPCILIQSN